MTVTDERPKVWETVREHVSSRFPILAEGEGWIGFRWKLGEGRVLRFKVALSSLAGEPHVLVMSPVASERDILPRQVLLEAANMAPSVIVEEGLYVVRQWLPVQGLPARDIDRAIALVAESVLRLMSHVVARPSSPRVSAGRPFANFAD
jgi:hypothetical protein